MPLALIELPTQLLRNGNWASPTTDLFISDRKRALLVWKTHRNVYSVSRPVDGVGFPRLHQRAEVPSLIACKDHLCSVDLGEHDGCIDECDVRETVNFRL